MDADGFNVSTVDWVTTYQVVAYLYSHFPKTVHGLQGRPPKGIFTFLVLFCLVVLVFVITFFTY